MTESKRLDDVRRLLTKRLRDIGVTYSPTELVSMFEALIDAKLAGRTTGEGEGESAGRLVYLLVGKTGGTCAVYGNATDAMAKCEANNADPIVDGDPDRDAPYSVHAWSVR